MHKDGGTKPQGTDPRLHLCSGRTLPGLRPGFDGVPWGPLSARAEYLDAVSPHPPLGASTQPCPSATWTLVQTAWSHALDGRTPAYPLLLV